MKLKNNQFYAFILILLISCGTNDSKTQERKEFVASSSDETQQAGLVGEWNQEYVCFDKNGNYKLEPEEKKASGTHLGFDWFKFNTDGSCQWDKDVKFKGTYLIQEKNGTKKLLIEGGDNFRYKIIELTDKELILGSDGAFMVFKRIK
jgi:hypothetical protein